MPTIMLDMCLPIGCPPESDVTFFDATFENYKVKLTFDVQGRLHFSYSNAGLSEQCIFSEIFFDPLTNIKIAVSFEPGNIIGSINGSTLNKFNQKSSQDYFPKPKVEKYTNLYGKTAVNIPNNISGPESTFLNLRNEIILRLENRNEHNLRELSGILRRLLTDETPLLHIINRKSRISLRFPIYMEPMLNTPEESIEFQFIAPYFSKISAPLLLNFDDFLKFHVVKFESNLFTVRDVIDLVANVKGGIHFGRAKKKSQEALFRAEEGIIFWDIEPTFRIIGDISVVVLEAIEPLVNILLGECNSDAI